uniref:Uncharacterized protein n=1 Tax=Oreochromis aureus TaxID=47969 RepID=A0A668VXK0_OREAU
MTAVLDPFEPFSSELHVIRRLNSSLRRDGGRDRPKTGHAGSLRLQPPAERVTLAPLRDDVPLLDPCCGQLSAGAEVVLGLKDRKKFIDFDHVPSALWVPPGFRERPQTTPNLSVVCVDPSEDKAWNSRRIPHAALRARLSGSSDPPCLKPRGRIGSPVNKLSNIFCATKEAVNQLHSRHSVHVSNGQKSSFLCRSYEDVGWITKVPRHLKAPEATLEKLADPVSERASLRRYNSRPQLWQVSHGECSHVGKHCRGMSSVFLAPAEGFWGSLLSGLSCMCSGTVGSENMDNIDNMDEDFHPLTVKRNSPSLAFEELGTSVFRHTAPLSRTVTAVPPCNPFMRPVEETQKRFK